MYRTALLLSLLLAAPSASALGFGSSKSETVPESALGPQQSRFTGDEGYFESWMVMLYLQGGDWIQARFMMTNIGPGDAHGAVDVMRYGKTPGEAGGKPKFTRYIDKIESKVRSLSGNPLKLQFRDSRLVKTKRGLRLELRAKGYSLDVDLTDRGPTWRPGSGEIKFGGGGRFGLQLMPALARVKGREKLKGGEWRDVSGSGWAEHAYTNVMAHKLSDRFLRFHGRKGKYGVSYFELFATEHFGKERMGYLLVTEGKKVVASTLVARSTPKAFKKDRQWPHHKVPKTYVVKAGDGDSEVALNVKTGATMFREDVLGTVPDWVRKVVRLFIQPVNYFHRARFSVRLPDGQIVEGRGVSLYSPMRAKL